MLNRPVKEAGGQEDDLDSFVLTFSSGILWEKMKMKKKKKKKKKASSTSRSLPVKDQGGKQQTTHTHTRATVSSSSVVPPEPKLNSTTWQKYETAQPKQEYRLNQNYLRLY